MAICTGRPQRVWETSESSPFEEMKKLRKSWQPNTHTVKSHHSGRGNTARNPRQEERGTAIRKGVNEGKNNTPFVVKKKEKRGWGVRGLGRKKDWILKQG